MYTIEVIPGVHQITVRYANMFLIAEEKLTLIDTGFQGSIRYIMEVIRQLGRSVSEISLIILTHNHLDHFGGLEDLLKLTKARVAIHQSDIIGADEIIPYPGGNHLTRLLGNPVLSPIRKRLLMDAEGIDIILHDNEVFDVLGELRVVPTPGHTPGSISLYAPRQKLLFVGDALKNRQNILRLPLRTASTDLKETLSSINRMAELDVNILCFGHGHPMINNVQEKLQALA
jgi:glyoxylase-like metal-dependent hydrolase (beta-lactamase superfamily II)